MGQLAKELGSTTKQAEGAAGSHFRLAKTRMTPETFSEVATAVPGMDQLVAAAPAIEAKGAAAGALGKKIGAEDWEASQRLRSRSRSSASSLTWSRRRCRW